MNTSIIFYRFRTILSGLTFIQCSLWLYSNATHYVAIMGGVTKQDVSSHWLLKHNKNQKSECYDDKNLHCLKDDIEKIVFP